MKKLIFLFLLLPCIAGAQNYLFEIEPQGNGTFRVLITDNTREAYPRDITDFGLVDTAELQLLAYQRIEQARSRQASLMAQSFVAELNAEQTTAAVGAVIPLNYSAWINAQLAGVYDGVYQYQVRGTAVNYAVVITGAELRRQSNNNLLARLSERSANWIRATVNGTDEVVNLYQFGNVFVGKNAAGQIVTLKRL